MVKVQVDKAAPCVGDFAALQRRGCRAAGLSPCCLIRSLFRHCLPLGKSLYVTVDVVGRLAQEPK